MNEEDSCSGKQGDSFPLSKASASQLQIIAEWGCWNFGMWNVGKSSLFHRKLEAHNFPDFNVGNNSREF